MFRVFDCTTSKVQSSRKYRTTHFFSGGKLASIVTVCNLSTQHCLRFLFLSHLPSGAETLSVHRRSLHLQSLTDSGRGSGERNWCVTSCVDSSDTKQARKLRSYQNQYNILVTEGALLYTHTCQVLPWQFKIPSWSNVLLQPCQMRERDCRSSKFDIKCTRLDDS